MLVGMRNVVSSLAGAGAGGEGFVVSFLCKLFNHQHLQIKAAPWLQYRSAGVKYRLTGGQARGEQMICKLNGAGDNLKVRKKHISKFLILNFFSQIR